MKLFDQNHDGKVEIGTEIKEYYENILKLQNALGSGNGTNLEERNGTESAEHKYNIAPENHLSGIPLDEYQNLLIASQNSLIKPNELNAVDVDGDGLLNIEEQTNLTTSIATKYMDNNGDGFVDGDESRAYDAKVAAMQFKVSKNVFDYIEQF